ncbi:DNA-formamidopyrimidine glycosylase [Aquimarina sp. ERC-38]|uniref:DNA-formamidopyrimidine glycosylase family protein n=1 Tax=Aquimarina sp. ERC-38 TaxID=2949996 RepID=UPI00224651C1|nr:DNA-formamidopyrimidine glycosylase family protein [Aquimarina sp. ERC-38]UZO82330.1 DNA-formamidopyrimidine glycosylase [Aquimarina sp. ERC-38]
MPELPEVYGYQQYLENTALHQKIVAFDCRDARLLKKPLADFETSLIGSEFTGTQRIGKYLFVKTSGKKIVLMHFGMTGKPTYYKEAEDRPKFGHIVLTFENGFHFAFENKRKFGRWDLVDTIEAYQKEHKLSKDTRDISLEEFKAALRNRKTAIKKVIMDQSVTAGVGNWIADDVLYQAQIHPEKNVADLSEEEIIRVYTKLQYVIETAIDLEAHYEDFPEQFMMRKRREIGADCHYTNGKIEKIVVGGRSTYYSPKWQHL